MDARGVIDVLGLGPHPEGGWYVERWRAPADAGGRPAASAILYLLTAGDRSHWHRVDAAEVWQWSAGYALELRIWVPGATGVTSIRLGGDVVAGDVPQAVVPAGAWQAARPLGAWALVGCIVAPAFEFAGFELAPPGWEPTTGSEPPPGREPPPGSERPPGREPPPGSQPTRGSEPPPDGAPSGPERTGSA